MRPCFDALVLMYRVATKLAARRHRAGGLQAAHARQAGFAAAVAARNEDEADRLARSTPPPPSPTRRTRRRSGRRA